MPKVTFRDWSYSHRHKENKMTSYDPESEGVENESQSLTDKEFLDDLTRLQTKEAPKAEDIALVEFIKPDRPDLKNLENNHVIRLNCPRVIGHLTSNNFSYWSLDEAAELLRQLDGEVDEGICWRDELEETDEVILGNAGWEIVSKDPFGIRHKDESMASGQGAQIILDSLKEEL